MLLLKYYVYEQNDTALKTNFIDITQCKLIGVKESRETIVCDGIEIGIGYEPFTFISEVNGNIEEFTHTEISQLFQGLNLIGEPYLACIFVQAIVCYSKMSAPTVVFSEFLKKYLLRAVNKSLEKTIDENLD